MSLGVVLLLIAVLVPAAAETGPTDAPVVVFVCEHGSAKSIVAAAHFNQLATQRGLAVRAVSRGTAPDAEIAPAAVTGLRSDGLAPPEAVPRKLQRADLEQAARVVIFNDLPPELAGSVAVERWEVPPVSTQYASSRDAMLAHIKELLDSLAAER